ncbi:MAG: relaxase/mobilization nuclease domain-containing protein [Candidatus Ancillula sp.]|jgi:hypothetical protein|nr:relaxase/mobilization nuclease domain-containing protein [Candidatus Ancillula sp.]
MIIKLISKPTSSKKLVNYLFGKGDANEHTDQHIVSSSSALHLDSIGLSIEEQQKLAIKYIDDVTPEDVRSTSRHLQHIVFSNPAGDVELLDKNWDDVAHEYAKLMGIQEHGGRWVAVRHGLSKNGNDHIHMIFNRYNLDGKQWNDSFDKQRTAKAARLIEQRFPFLSKHLKHSEVRSEQSYTAQEFATYAEHLAYERFSADSETSEKYKGKEFFDLSENERQKLIWNIKSYELPRRKLQGLVRAAAVSSTSEDEFVRRLRSNSVLLKPRFDKNNPKQVIGYSVALRLGDKTLPDGSKSYWYGGNKLANDLSIKRLRMHWAGVEDPSVADMNEVNESVFLTSSKAFDEWKAARDHKRAVHKGPEKFEPDTDDFKRCSEQLVALRDKLKEALEDGDPVNMARTNRYVSATFSNMSRRFELTASPMHRFALQVAVAAQTRDDAVSNLNQYKHMDLDFQALLGVNRILQSGSKDYTSILNLMKTVFEIGKICQENYLLEEELRRAKQGVEILKSELLVPFKMTDVDGITDLVTRIKTADDLEKSSLIASRSKVEDEGEVVESADFDTARSKTGYLQENETTRQVEDITDELPKPPQSMRNYNGGFTPPRDSRDDGHPRR